ncbi:protein of unknown function [Rhodovastum atsumiense]|nr:protein of unknown function [Rhodovastum atsumiense]
MCHLMIHVMHFRRIIFNYNF